MKLRWTTSRDGSEVAGPFVVRRIGVWHLFADNFPQGLVFVSRAQAKRAAQRIADKIVRNMKGAK